MGGGYFWNSRKSQVFNMADVARREVEGGGGVGGVLHRSVSAVRRNGAGVDFCIFSRPAGGRWPICGILLWVATAGKAWWAADIWLGVGGDSGGGVGGGRGGGGGWLRFSVGGGLGALVGV